MGVMVGLSVDSSEPTRIRRVERSRRRRRLMCAMVLAFLGVTRRASERWARDHRPSSSSSLMMDDERFLCFFSFVYKRLLSSF